MTPQEAAALLAVAAAFDNRKPDADAAQAWALALDDLPFLDCRNAIVAHYRTSSEWLMPAVVRTAVKRVRDKRIAEAGDLTPPRGLSDEQERAWLRDARRRIGDGQALEDVHGDRKPHPELAAKVAELMPRPSLHPEPEGARAELAPIPHTTTTAVSLDDPDSCSCTLALATTPTHDGAAAQEEDR